MAKWGGTKTDWGTDKGVDTDEFNRIEENIQHNHDRITETPQVAVVSGTVDDGEKLPLPSGYTQSQCRWIVSVRSLGGRPVSGFIHSVVCYVTSSRVVRVYSDDLNTGPSGPYRTSGRANYLVIGVK